MPPPFSASSCSTEPCAENIQLRRRLPRERRLELQRQPLNKTGFIQRHKKTFSRATATSVAATVVDVGTLYCLVEFIHVYYVVATALGAVAGACTNFTLNRVWAFESRKTEVHVQGVRYAVVSGASLGLNTLLVFCFTEFGQLMYLTSKAIAAVAVGWGWNYPLHRYFVFAQDQNIDKGQPKNA